MEKKGSGCPDLLSEAVLNQRCNKSLMKQRKHHLGDVSAPKSSICQSGQSRRTCMGNFYVHLHLRT